MRIYLSNRLVEGKALSMIEKFQDTDKNPIKHLYIIIINKLLIYDKYCHYIFADKWFKYLIISFFQILHTATNLN